MGEKIKAVIFDMDGVISDTQKANSELESLCLKECGIEIGVEELINNYAGIPERECAEMIFAAHGKKTDFDEFVENKLARLAKFSKGKILAIEGSLELIKTLKNNNFKLAVASSSRPDFIDLVLSELGVKDKFDFLISGQEVKLGKPNPDIFLLTAEKLGVPPSECVVIEDAKNGVMAAKRAGMKCIWLTDHDFFEKNEGPADIIVKSLSELRLENFA